MSDIYISQESAIKAICRSVPCPTSICTHDCCEVAAVRAIPAADVRPVKHGTWKHLGGDEWCCGVCGHVISTEGSWENPLLDHGIRFCENCGASMDGGAE